MSDTAVVTAAAVIVLGGLGLAVGSFLNVVIYRVPRDLSIVRPGSACPQCSTPISTRDNIPVLSWLLLRGRCRTCGNPIPVRYPIIEIVNALTWLGLAWWSEDAGHLGLLPLLLVLSSAGIALFAIDLEHYRLPNAIVLPLYPVTVVGLAIDGLVSGDWPIGPALIGAGVWLLIIGGLWLVSGGRGMGFGDVKLAPVLGATLGWLSVSAAIVGLFAAFALGAVVGIILLITRRAGRRSALPFGPFLLLGALVGLLAGSGVAAGYAGMLVGT